MDEISRLHQNQMIALQRATSATTDKGREAYLAEARRYEAAIDAARGLVGDRRRNGRRAAELPAAVPLALGGLGSDARPGRRNFARTLACDCGARGEAVFEEDDLNARPTGGANIELVWISGPFRRDARGRFLCLECNSRIPAA